MCLIPTKCTCKNYSDRSLICCLICYLFWLLTDTGRTIVTEELCWCRYISSLTYSPVDIGFLQLIISKAVPLQAWTAPWGSGRLRPWICLTFGTRKWKVISLTHRPALLPGIFLILIFRGWVDPRAHGSVGSLGKNPQWHHWGSIPRPPD
jgi:hypothetical protein